MKVFPFVRGAYYKLKRALPNERARFLENTFEISTKRRWDYGVTPLGLFWKNIGANAALPMPAKMATAEMAMKLAAVQLKALKMQPLSN